MAQTVGRKYGQPQGSMKSRRDVRRIGRLTSDSGLGRFLLNSSADIAWLSRLRLGIHGIKPMCPRSPCIGDAPKGDLDDHGRRSAIDDPAD